MSLRQPGLQARPGARIQLMRCDITKVEADACVVSVHRSKDMNRSCLGRNIVRACGKEVQDELYQRNPGKELEFGQVETDLPPGRQKNIKELMLICLYIYRPGNEQTLQQSMNECLELAVVKGYRTIAFSGLGLGQNYPPVEVARVMVEAVALHNFQFDNTSLEEVKIVLFDQDFDIIEAFLAICYSGTTDPHGQTDSETADMDDVTDLMDTVSIHGQENVSSSNTTANSRATSHSPNLQQGPKPSSKKPTKGPNGGGSGGGAAANGLAGLTSNVLSFLFNKIFSRTYGPLCFTVKPTLQGKTKVGLQFNVTVDIFFLANFVPDKLKTELKKYFK